MSNLFEKLREGFHCLALLGGLNLALTSAIQNRNDVLVNEKLNSTWDEFELTFH